MSETIPAEDLQAAQAYEDLHVAALFAEWAPRVLEGARVGPGDDVLDVACGTGVLAREAARRVGPEGSVAGLDLSPAMLAVAEQITPAVTWRRGDASTLPFEADSFDAVVSQFGLMFFPQRVESVREMARVLRRGGRMCAAVWDTLDASPAYAIEVEILDRLAGAAAADALRAPFVLGDTRELAAIFESAGVGAVEVSTVIGEARFPSIRSMVEADLRGWLPVMGVHLDESAIGRILAEADDALAQYVTDDGALAFASSAHIVSATG